MFTANCTTSWPAGKLHFATAHSPMHILRDMAGRHVAKLDRFMLCVTLSKNESCWLKEAQIKKAFLEIMKDTQSRNSVSGRSQGKCNEGRKEKMLPLGQQATRQLLLFIKEPQWCTSQRGGQLECEMCEWFCQNSTNYRMHTHWCIY